MLKVVQITTEQTAVDCEIIAEFKIDFVRAERSCNGWLDVTLLGTENELRKYLLRVGVEESDLAQYF